MPDFETIRTLQTQMEEMRNEYDKLLVINEEL
jgi:hypothetical protein